MARRIDVTNEKSGTLDCYLKPLVTIQGIHLYQTDFESLTGSNWLTCKVWARLIVQFDYTFIHLQVVEAYLQLICQNSKKVYTAVAWATVLLYHA